jgi:hypothetical protein
MITPYLKDILLPLFHGEVEMTAGTANQVTGSRNSIAYKLLSLVLCASAYGCATKDHRLDYPVPEEFKELSAKTESLGDGYEIRFLADNTKPDGVARNDMGEPLISGASGPCYDNGNKKICEAIFDKGYTFTTLKNAKIVNLDGIAVVGFKRAQSIFEQIQSIGKKAEQQYYQDRLKGKWSVPPSPEIKAAVEKAEKEEKKANSELKIYDAGRDLYNLGGLSPYQNVPLSNPQKIIKQATP